MQKSFIWPINNCSTKIVSLFAWIFSQELLEIKLFSPAVLELVKKILSSLQLHCSLNISKNTNYTDKYRSALGGNKTISMLPWKRHKHTFLWLQKAGIIIGIDRFQNMLKKYSYLLSMHWVRSTALRQHFLCMGNSQEAVFIVDACARSKENCSDWVDTKWQHHGRVWKISLDSEQQQQLQVWGNKQTKNGELETDIISGIFWLVDAAQLKSCNYNKNVQIVGYAFLHFMGVICSLQ